MQTPATVQRTSDLVGALVLLAIGGAVFAGLVSDVDAYVMLAIGIVSLIGFTASRAYALAITAGTTTGIGVAVVLITQVLEATLAAPAIMLSMAGGFAATWLLGLASRPAERHPWPLLTAAVFGLIGGSIVLEAPLALDVATAIGAVVIALVGVVIVVRRAA